MKPQHQNTNFSTACFDHTTFSKAWHISQLNTTPLSGRSVPSNSKQYYTMNTGYGSNQTYFEGNSRLLNHDNFQNFNSYSTTHSTQFSNPPHEQQIINQPSSIQHCQHLPNINQSKLPSIKELLREIEVTVRKEEIINVANTIPEKTTSLSIKDQTIHNENQTEKNESTTNQITTHHRISNSFRVENTNTRYNTNHVDNKGITTFGNKKICKQKSTRYLSETANLILKQWLYDNWHNPYPDQSDKQYLSKLANITVAQVNNYFINARRRVCKKMKNPPSSIHALP